MARLLVPVGACGDAAELAPLLRAATAAGHAVAVAWFGPPAELEAARRLGLPEPAHAEAPPPAAGPPARFAAATAFAAEVLGGGRWDRLVALGHGTAVAAFVATAGRVGLGVLRANAGQRVHAAWPPGDRERRVVDHAAEAWATASEAQRLELAREGLPLADLHVVGSLWPAALAALPAVPPSGQIWLALEHAHRLQAAPLAALLAQLAAAGRALGLPVAAAAAGLQPTLAGHGLVLPPGITLADLDPREQLDAARAARALVTDSAGYQELAAVLGVPCLVAAAATARPEAILAGCAHLVGHDGEALAAKLPWALERPVGPSPYADGLAALLALLAGPTAAPTAPSATAVAPLADRLPSDADHSGRTLGDDEVAFAAAAIRSGTLNSTRGTFVARFERDFAAWLGRGHAIACSSGTMAMHAAIAALGLAPGDEVITTPITDMGAITPILYEGGVPVFADVDRATLNVTAATIRAQLTERTRAIVVTHLFGGPCDLEPILALAAGRGLPVIEDCAQAFGATVRGRKVGTAGTIAAFSLQQGKHITCGEGGIVATDDPSVARRLFLFVNKAWGYGDAAPDHTFPALNGRLGELAGAVALAQLPKLDWVVSRRREVAAALHARLAPLPGLRLPGDPPYGTHAWWRFAFAVDADEVPGGALALGRRMQAAGIACVPRYVQKPAFECALFTDWRRSPITWLPLQQNPRLHGPQPPFRREHYPGAVRGLEQVVVLPINERYRLADVDRVAAAISAALRELRRG
ncbi:MAG: DegT/DnrJ/EryC1/StrS family aminotransferase [Planctomycetes bacterium]|nr:DegT/DnrJ/EryC1/StrS family aminotransferase [Planctomycetota bacterium]